MRPEPVLVNNVLVLHNRKKESKQQNASSSSSSSHLGPRRVEIERLQIELEYLREGVEVTSGGHRPVAQPGVLPPGVRAPVALSWSGGLRLGRQIGGKHLAVELRAIVDSFIGRVS